MDKDAWGAHGAERATTCSSTLRLPFCCAPPSAGSPSGILAAAAGTDGPGPLHGEVLRGRIDSSEEVEQIMQSLRIADEVPARDGATEMGCFATGILRPDEDRDGCDGNDDRGA